MPSINKRPRQAKPAGTTLRRGKDGLQQIATAGHRWTDEAEAVFLEDLATHCNVTRAAAACGFSTVAIYRRRAQDAGFSERWHAALEQGYARLEMALVRWANDVMAPAPTQADTPLSAGSVRDAIAILKLHRPAVHGDGRAPGRWARPRSLDEVRGSILAKLEAIEIARRSKPQRTQPDPEPDRAA
jgi:hypothetical protein